MKATITGNDHLSKQILGELAGGLRVSEVPNHYPVSLDQAKRLSRFKRMLEMAKGSLDEVRYERLKALGIKSLPLSRLFKKQDWAGVAEILSVITDETTREDLKLLIMGLDEKRERIVELKESSNVFYKELKKKDKDLRTKESAILQLKNKVIDMFKAFQLPKSSQASLMEHLGMYEGSLILVKKIKPDWLRTLKEQEIIVYSEEWQTYLLRDFNSFLESFRTMYPAGLEFQRDAADLGSYGLVDGSIQSLPQHLEYIRKERVSIEEELRRLENITFSSYKEIADVQDLLSANYLKRRKEMQDRALKWLFQRDFIVAADFPLPNGKKADIFAYNDSQIVIFDIKVSHGDLSTDKRWYECLPYCHDFYFLTPPDLKSAAIEKIGDTKCGCYTDIEEGLKLIKPDERVGNKVENQESLKFMAGQQLSRKFIYGY